MLKKYLIPLLVFTLSVGLISPVYAKPQRDIAFGIWPVYFQNENPWKDETYGCKEDDAGCKATGGKRVRSTFLSLTIQPHNLTIGKPQALLGDSQSLTFTGLCFVPL